MPTYFDVKRSGAPAFGAAGVAAALADRLEERYVVRATPRTPAPLSKPRSAVAGLDIVQGASNRGCGEGAAKTRDTNAFKLRAICELPD